MKDIKVLGSGCQKCKITYGNVIEALKKVDMEANVQKVEDIEEMLKYNILSTPVLMIDEQIKIEGRIAHVGEIIELLKN